MSNAHFAGVALPRSPVDPHELARLRDENRVLQSHLERLDRKAIGYATVIEIHKTYLQLQIAGGPLVDADPPAGMELTPGDCVRINAHGQITAKAPRDHSFGAIVTVEAVAEPMLEVAFANERKLVRGAVKAKAQDRVLLDGSNNIAVRNLGPAPSPMLFAGDIAVEWDEVGGLVEAKRALREMVEEPVLHRQLYARYGRRPATGALLYGPPGTGKTMLAKAAATAHARVHGAKTSDGCLILVKGPELLDKWTGNTEKGIRAIFQTARQHQEREGYPAMICIDEADALLGKRGRSVYEGMERTVVPAFLAEMDGLGSKGAIVLLATNRNDVLDPAIVRDGRVDRKIRVGRPSIEDAKSIAKNVLRGRPILEATADKIAEVAAEEIFRDAHALAVIRCKDDRQSRRFSLRDIVNGAMIVGVIENATQYAIRREHASGEEDGITEQDVRAAVAQALEESRATDHTDVLAELLEPLKKGVVSVDWTKP